MTSFNGIPWRYWLARRVMLWANHLQIMFLTKRISSRISDQLKKERDLPAKNQIWNDVQMWGEVWDITDSIRDICNKEAETKVVSCLHSPRIGKKNKKERKLALSQVQKKYQAHSVCAEYSSVKSEKQNLNNKKHLVKVFWHVLSTTLDWQTEIN